MVVNRAPKWNRIRRDAGGAWLNYLPTYLWLGPVWAITSVLATPGLTTIESVAALTIANVAGVLGAVSLIALSNVTFFRNRANKAVPITVVLCFGAIVGAIKALITSLIITSLNGTNLEGLTARLLISAVLGMWLIPTIAVAYATLQRYERERNTLAKELIRQQFRDASFGETAAIEIPRVEVSEFVQLARVTVAGANGPRELSSALTTIIDTQLRPLCRALNEEIRSQLPSFRLPDLISVVWREFRFTPLGTSLAYIVTFIAPQIWYAGIGDGLLRVITQAGIVFVVLWLAQRLPKRGGVFGIATFVIVNGLLVFVLDAVSTMLFGPLPQYPRGAAIALLLCFFVLSGLILGTIRTAVNEDAEVRMQLQQLSQRSTQTQTRSVVDEFERRELAHYLHSRVQNGMLSIALKVGLSDRSTDISPLQEELYDILDEALAPFGHRPNHNASSAFVAIKQQWAGITYVSITADHECLKTIDSSGVLRTSIVLVVEEAITNAVRHGSATEITISILLDEGRSVLTLQCLDNGGGSLGMNRGLGTNLFDSVSRQWSISRTASQHTLLWLHIDTDIAHGISGAGVDVEGTNKATVEDSHQQES